MPRLPRFVLVGHLQHVIIRGNNREAIFYADEDYQFYLEMLKSIEPDSLVNKRWQIRLQSLNMSPPYFFAIL